MSQQINLYNPVFLKQKHYFSALTMVQALGVVLAGAIGIYAFEVNQNAKLERVLDESDRQVSAQRDQLVKFSKEFSEAGASRTLTEELARAEQRLQSRQGLLNDLKTGVGGNVEGFARYLGALSRQTVPGVWLTGLEIGTRDGGLLLKGRALESQLVPAYIRALNREAPMSGRAVGELRLTSRSEAAAEAEKGEPRQYIEFSLSIPPKGKS